MIRRALAVLALVLGFVLAGAAPASAVPMLPSPFDDCKEAPTPESPTMGLQGMIAPPPEVLPRESDPFAASPSTTILEQYGAAGTGWVTYDTGCMPGDGMQAKYQTAIANWLMSGARNGPAVVASIGNNALAPGWSQFIEAPARAVSAALHDVFTSEFMPLTIIMAAIAVALMARRMQLGGAMLTTFAVLAATTVAALALNYPERITQGVTEGMTAASAGIYQEVTDSGSTGWTEADKATVGSKMVAPLYKANVYDQWLTGTLGSSVSPIAVKYGPDLFKAKTLTWREGQIVENDPDGEGKAIIEAKAELWTSTAEKIAEEDPIAYRYLVGDHSGERLMIALYAGYANLATLPFPAAAFWVLIAAVMVFMIMVILLPIVATVMVLPRYHHLGVSMLKTLGLIIMNTILFAIAGATVVALSVKITDATQTGLGRGIAFLLILTLSVVAWIYTRPLRSVGAMLRSFEWTKPVGDLPGKAKHAVGKAASFTGGFLAGGAAGGAVVAAKQRRDDDDADADADQTSQQPDNGGPSSPAPVDPGLSSAPKYQRPPAPRTYQVYDEHAVGDDGPTDVWQTAPSGEMHGPSLDDRALPPAPSVAAEAAYPVAARAGITAGAETTTSPAVGTNQGSEAYVPDIPAPEGPDADGVSPVTPLHAPVPAEFYAHTEVYDGQEVFVVYDPSLEGDGAFTTASATAEANTEMEAGPQ